MPALMIITKFGMGVAMLSCYSACYSGDTIFPADKRSTAIGIVNIVARSLTIFASQVNELKPPLPMLTFTTVVAIALISSFITSGNEIIDKRPQRHANGQQAGHSPGSQQGLSYNKPINLNQKRPPSTNNANQDLSTASNYHDGADQRPPGATPTNNSHLLIENIQRLTEAPAPNTPYGGEHSPTPQGYGSRNQYDSSSYYSKSETLYSIRLSETSNSSVDRMNLFADCHVSGITHRESNAESE